MAINSFDMKVVRELAIGTVLREFKGYGRG